MTPLELKRNVEKLGSKFFNKENMRFSGDTMANYGVSNNLVRVISENGEISVCYVLYRKNPVKNGLNKNAYFDNLSFKRILTNDKTIFQRVDV